MNRTFSSNRLDDQRWLCNLGGLDRVTRKTTFAALFFLFLVTLGLSCPSADAQAGAWAWMGGSSTMNCPTPNASDTCYGPAVVGKLGASSSSYVPGGRVNAYSWTDLSGNFWIFGGGGHDAAGAFSYLNDLWKFDPTNGQWAWAGGSSTTVCMEKDLQGACVTNGQPGVSASQGVGSTTNIPGGRQGGVSWTDPSGNLWLFGGIGFDTAGNFWGYLNDLWEFSPSTGEWTWVSGTAAPTANPGLSGVYGALGAAGAGNVPGGRNGPTAWADTSGNLWLFGGYGIDSAGHVGELNDLWEFTPSTRNWAWMGGSSTFTCWVPGASSSNCNFWAVLPPVSTPEGRDTALSWTDSGGNFWLFGGNSATADPDNLSSAMLGDLWELNPATATWTVRGYCPSPQLAACGNLNIGGVYGALGVEASGNYPGSRNDGPGWSNGSGLGWLFGGPGFSSSGAWGSLNDLWEFDSFTGEWAWEGGSDTQYTGPNQGPSGIYGNPGSANANNLPGYRGGAVNWTDNQGNLWLFGGNGVDSAGNNGQLNDLWEYMPASSGLPVAATPTFSVPSGTYTSAQSVTLHEATAGTTLYYTTDGTSPISTSSVYNGPIAVSATSTLKVIAVEAGYAYSPIATANYVLPVTFSVGASPATLTVDSGNHGAVTVTVTPQNGFNSAVSFACSGLPAGASCGFSPATVSPNGAAASTQLTFTAAAQTAALPARPMPFLPVTTLSAALCLFGWKRRRKLQGMLLLLLAAAGFGLLSGCSSSAGNGGGTNPPPPVTQTVTVTATAGNIQQNTTVTLTLN